MRDVIIQPTFESWREAARRLLADGVAPDGVLWSDDESQGSLFGGEEAPGLRAVETPRVPSAFMDLARTAAAHTDPRRWGLLYHILWRITRGGERHLMALPTDPDMLLIRQWCKAVGRGIHKMHAFVRFRRVGVDETTGREQFVAWFEPEYRITRLAAPFFRKRFANMDWSILTPHECAHWDGETLHFSPGVPREAAPDEDELDDLWRTYYRSIFNPARLKLNAMRSEMPKKYWKNLPEASVIDELVAQSRSRVKSMLESEERPVKSFPQNPYLESLRQKNSQTGGEEES
jgi:DNA polymerase